MNTAGIFYWDYYRWRVKEHVPKGYNYVTKTNNKIGISGRCGISFHVGQCVCVWGWPWHEPPSLSLSLSLKIASRQLTPLDFLTLSLRSHSYMISQYTHTHLDGDNTTLPTIPNSQFPFSYFNFSPYLFIFLL